MNNSCRWSKTQVSIITMEERKKKNLIIGCCCSITPRPAYLYAGSCFGERKRGNTIIFGYRVYAPWFMCLCARIKWFFAEQRARGYRYRVRSVIYHRVLIRIQCLTAIGVTAEKWFAEKIKLSHNSSGARKLIVFSRYRATIKVCSSGGGRYRVSRHRHAATTRNPRTIFFHSPQWQRETSALVFVIIVARRESGMQKERAHFRKTRGGFRVLEK